MSKFKRTLCMLLSLVMVLGMFPVSAFATAELPELLPAEPVVTEVIPEPLPVLPEIPVVADTTVPEYIPEPLPELPTVPEVPVVPEEPVVTEAPVVTPEPTVAPAPVVQPVAVYFNCSPAELSLYVYDAYGVPVMAEADGGYLLMPGDYTYSACAEGYMGIDSVPFIVAEGSEAMSIGIMLSPISFDAPVVEEESDAEPEEEEDGGELVESEELVYAAVITAEELGIDSALLEEYYLSGLFYGQISTFGTLARERLTSDVDKYVYDQLKSVLNQISSGNRSSTVVEIDLNGTGYYADSANLIAIIDAIYHDCPYEFFWYSSATLGYYSTNQLVFKFIPSAYYQPAGYNADSPTIDTVKLQRAVTAANTAAAIVTEYAALSDYDKLCAYADKICSLVEYDWTAVTNNTYDLDISPWSLVNVFDGDSSTNVVCEGYAEAFQYLCDNSTFTNEIEVYCATGVYDDPDGGHKWNIVRINGVSYLMDVTHCDAGSYASRSVKFLDGANGSIDTGYSVSDSFGTYTYWYYPATIDLWGNGEDSILKLSGTAYDPEADEDDGDSIPVEGSFNGLPAYVDAAGNLAINANNFPDDAFRSIVKANFDTDEDGVLSLTEVAAITEIIVPDRRIYSLEGIEFFSELVKLDCSNKDTADPNNSISAIDLSHNTKLEYLDCGLCGNSCLDVSGCKNLKWLDCSHSYAESFDFTANTALEYLDCSYGFALKSVDASGLSKLNYLDCNYSQSMNSLLVRNCVALEYLNCSVCELSSLNVTGCPALKYLNCGSNDISTLNVTSNTQLESLLFYKNNISSINLSKCTGLKLLHCDNNKLRHIDLSRNAKLEEIHASHNNLTHLDLSSCPLISGVYTSGDGSSPAQTVTASEDAVWYGDRLAVDMGSIVGYENIGNVAGLSNYDTGTGFAFLKAPAGAESFTFSYVYRIPTAEPGWYYLLSVQVSVNISSACYLNSGNFPDPNFLACISCSFDPAGKGYLSAEELAAVTSIDCSCMGIESLKGIEFFSNLESLDCSGNRLLSLDLSRNIRLTSVRCDAQSYEAAAHWTGASLVLDLGAVVSADKLGFVSSVSPGSYDAGTGYVTLPEPADDTVSMELSYIYNTQGSAGGSIVYMPVTLTVSVPGRVYIDESNFPDPNFRQYISNTFDTEGLGFLSAEKIGSIDVIQCGWSNISSLEGIEHFSALSRLECYGNDLTSLDLSRNRALTAVSCDMNYGLRTLELGSNPNIIAVVCSETALSRLDLSGLPALRSLTCYDCNLGELDVSANTALEALYCGGNSIQYLDLSRNVVLENLQCEENELSSLDVRNNTLLSTLRVNGNNIPALNLANNTSLNYLYGGQSVLAKAKVTGDSAILNLGSLIGESNTAYVSNVSGGSYDSDTGLVTISIPSGVGSVSISYDYNTQAAPSNGGIISVTATVILEEDGAYISPATFPDAAFRSYVIDYLDEDGLGYLTREQLEGVYSISCEGMGIRSLKGIEYFPNVFSLYCSNNEISEIDMSALPSLAELYCSNNDIYHLDKVDTLSSLDCSGNFITELDFGQLGFMSTLDVSRNRIATLGLSKFYALSGFEGYGQFVSATAYRSGSSLTVDMADVVGKSNLSRVSNVVGGSYNSSTGVVTISDYDEGGYIRFSYSYDTGYPNEKLSLTATVIIDEISECMHVWDKGYISTQPTCDIEGVRTYTCTKCGGTKTEEVPTVAHSLIPQAGHYTECSGGYPYDYYWCEVCYSSFVDAEGTERVEWIEGTGAHDMEFEAGNFIPCLGGYKEDHYYCTLCNSRYVDAEATEYAEWTVGDGPHDMTEYPGYYTVCNGGIKDSYYVCSACEQSFGDAEGTTPAEWVPGNGRHSLVKREADYIPCGGGFTEDYYWCKVCNYCFTDTTASSSAEWVPGDGSHELEFHESNYTICGGGYKEAFYHCVHCSQTFADENGTEFADFEEGLGGHKLVKKNVAAVAATDEEPGIKAHTFYYCENCETPLKSNGYEYSSEELDKYLESLVVYPKAKNVVLSNELGEITSGSTVAVELSETAQMQLYAEVVPIAARKEVTWKSSSTAIATVDADGLVTFLKPGLVTITATAKDGSGKSANVKFDVQYMGYAANVKFTGKIADMSTGFDGKSYSSPTKNGLQEGDSVQLILFGADKTTPISDLSVFEFSVKSVSNGPFISVDDKGVVTALKVGTGAVTAKLRGDPLNRSFNFTIKTIAQQIGKVNILPGDPDDVNFSYAAESDAYTLSQTMEPKSGGSIRSYQLKVQAIGSSGDELADLKGRFTWASSNSSIATVTEDKYGNVTLSIKPGVDGLCNITATAKDTVKAQGVLYVSVKDFTPRLESSTAVIDSQLSGTTSLAIVSSYGNSVTAVEFQEYDSKTRTYVTSGKVLAEYEPVRDDNGTIFYEYVHLTSDGFLKNQTIKGQLKVNTDTDKLEYYLPLNINIKNTVPAVTVKQLNKFNLFYTDSEARVTVTAKNDTVKGVTIKDNANFESAWENGELVIRFKEGSSSLKPDTKLTLCISLASCENAMEKAFTLGTENKKPNLALDPANATVNLSLGNDRLYIKVKDNATKGYLSTAGVEVRTNPDIGEVKALDDYTFEAISNRSEFFSKGGGRVNVSIKGDNWVDAIVLAYNLKVNTTLPVLKPKTATLTINSLFDGMSAETEAVITQANVQGAHIEEATLTPAKVGDAEAAKLIVSYANGKFVAVLDDSTIKNGNYQYSFIPKCIGYNADGSSYTVDLAPVKLTVRVINTQPTAKLSKTSVTLNNMFTSQTAAVELIPADTSHGIHEFNAVSKAKADTPAWNESQNIRITETDGVITAQITDSTVKPGNYQYSIEAKLGSESANAAIKPLTLSVRVVNTQPKVTLSANSISLNTVEGLAGWENGSITLESGTAGYSVVGCEVSRTDTKADVLDYSNLIDIECRGAMVVAGLKADALPKAGTYKFAVTPIVAPVVDGDPTDDTAKLKPINFTVRVYANAKYSATVAASGKLDAVVRDSSAITYTLTKLNNVSGKVVSVDKSGQDADSFEVSFAGYTKGQPTAVLKLKSDETYYTAKTYKLQLDFLLDNGITVSTNALSVKVTSSAIRLVSSPKTVNVYQSQSKLRMVFYDMSITAPVGARIDSVQLGKLNAQQQAFMDVCSYYTEIAADGQSARVKLVIQDVKSLGVNKTYTLPLEVWADGQLTSTPAKLNMSVKVLK